MVQETQQESKGPPIPMLPGYSVRVPVGEEYGKLLMMLESSIRVGIDGKTWLGKKYNLWDRQWARGMRVASGHGARLQPGNRTFRLSQTLQYQKGYQTEDPVRVAYDVPEQVQELKTDGAYMPPTSETTWKSTLPQWIENDRQVLRFMGFYREHVTERDDENARVRKLIIYYYLEDDSQHVAEPKQDNSGIPQGMFIKRHRITKPDGTFFSPADFVIGCEVELYGKRIMLVDADTFTRQWMKDNLGEEMVSPLPFLDEPFQQHKKRFERAAKTLGPPCPRTDSMRRFTEAKLGRACCTLGEDRLKQFIENDRKVLRFWCYWDDRHELYGDRRPYVLNYYLADDTIEICEIKEENSSRDPFPVFLARGPLPKGKFRHFKFGTRYTPDLCYSKEDLRIGCTVFVHGRPMLLFDCDAFTNAWYKQNMQLTDAELKPLDVAEPIPLLHRPGLPPYNGHGTLDDSVQNCLRLLPKPPKKDVRKLVNRDRMILRFVGRFKETDQFKMSVADQDRKFVLSYFMADDTMAIFEPPLRNSGVMGGKFLERSKLYKPGTEEPFTYLDLFVGANLTIWGRTFVLEEADEYTYAYMENNKHMFLIADPKAISQVLLGQLNVEGGLEKLKDAFMEMDKDGSGQLEVGELAQAFEQADIRIVRHQVITLFRLLDKDSGGTVDIGEFMRFLGVEDAAKS